MIYQNRRTQPYRKGARRPSGALAAMLLGQSPTLGNPQDASRQATKQASRPPLTLAELLRRPRRSAPRWPF